jgi:isoleucyl-tRNA synthetase
MALPSLTHRRTLPFIFPRAVVAVGRFHNWLRDARDWAISRNRYWGTPLPIWASEDYSEIVVVGSIAELRERTGRQDITDLHRESIDGLTIPSARPGQPPLKRVDGASRGGGSGWCFGRRSASNTAPLAQGRRRLRGVVS